MEKGLSGEETHNRAALRQLARNADLRRSLERCDGRRFARLARNADPQRSLERCDGRRFARLARNADPRRSVKRCDGRRFARLARNADPRRSVKRCDGRRFARLARNADPRRSVKRCDGRRFARLLNMVCFPFNRNTGRQSFRYTISVIITLNGLGPILFPIFSDMFSLNQCIHSVTPHQ